MTTAPSATEVPPLLVTPAQRRAMRTATLVQCAGSVGSLIFTNGLLLLYLQALGFSSVATLVTLSLHELARLLMPAAAHLSDRRGIKRVGSFGLALTIVGFAALTLAGFCGGGDASGGEGWQRAAHAAAVGGAATYAIGWAIFSAGWFALLAGFVPEAVRGRFFGALRFAWQAVVITFTAACAVALPADAPLWGFQVAMGVLFLGQIARLLFYRRVPELQAPRGGDESFLRALRHVAQRPQYLGFCAYVFLLAMFTAGAPIFFSMTEKQFLGLGDGTVVLLGGGTMLGLLIGFLAGGWITDALGTKTVFMLCHLGFALVLASFPLRELFPGDLRLVLAALHLALGATSAASSVAITKEVLSLMEPRRRSLSTAVCMTLQGAGAALSTLLAAGAVKIGIFRDHWSLLGSSLSQYDAILLINATFVAVLVVALGLVPSIAGKPPADIVSVMD